MNNNYNFTDMMDATALLEGDALPHPQWMQETVDERPAPDREPRKHRSIWISDVHLGTRGSKAEFLCDFLKHNDCDTLYLVGDIIDGWRMKNRTYWPQAHINVIRRILTRSKRGTHVVYVTGNHDEFLRRYSGMSFGNIHLVDETVHTTADGRKLWVVHGDAFDSIVCNQKWLALVGDWAYESMLRFNVLFNRARQMLGMEYWSLSAYLKYKVKKAVNFISDYEKTLAHECEKRGLHGVVCGHIHHPEVTMIGEVQYANSGDWVESCSAVVEDRQGQLEVIYWGGKNRGRQQVQEARRQAA
ncbi:MAG: UDP-2,3-diacylglucosamine diphosphatase [Chromatiales bacterium]|jgi:UDP-2,3-diacylglucosamine pyrophosphatase LpxH